jgi:hypothetical protein
MLWVLAHEFEKYFNKDRKLMCIHSEYQTRSVIQWSEHSIVHSEVLILLHVCLKLIRTIYCEYHVIFLSTNLYRVLYQYIISIT